MRKIRFVVQLFLFLNLSITTFSQTATPPSAGDGSESNPYQIATLENLYWLTQSDTVWDKHFIQNANIDASETVNWDGGKGFSPIGNWTTPFNGFYNGKGYIVDSIFVNSEVFVNQAGFFGVVYDMAIIDSLGLTNVNIKGVRYVGGLVGHNEGKITSCYTTGNCICSGDYVGGLAGDNSGDIESCYSNADIYSDDDYTGGLVGRNQGAINQSYSIGDVTIGTYDAYGGGLVGGNYGAINYSYSFVNLEVGYETDYIGGLVGNNYGVIKCSYSIGNVEHVNAYHSGGMIGSNNTGGNIIQSFWNIETSGQEISDGGIGLLSAEMKDSSTYLINGWDFMDETFNGTNNYWSFNSNENEGYPFLYWQEYKNNVECQAPFFSESIVIFSVILDNSITIDSIANSAYGVAGYCVYLNAQDSAWNIPDDGAEPITNSEWQDNGPQCVYFGTSKNPEITISGLNKSTKYYFKVYVYNDCSGKELYEQNGTLLSRYTAISITKPEGDGGLQTPFNISNHENLVWLMQNDTVWTKNFIQTQDIDMSFTADSNQIWGGKPIGNLTYPFTGSYNGKGHTLSQLTIKKPTNDNIGLFGYISSGANIDSLGVVNSEIEGNSNVGVLVGKNNDGIIKNCYTTGECEINDVRGGGFVGSNKSEIKHCYSNVNVFSKGGVVGGFVGYNIGNITQSYSIGTVSGSYSYGGFAGIGSTYGNIISSFWDIESSGQEMSSGGNGLLSADMQDSSIYLNAGWDFMDEITNGEEDIWGMNGDVNKGYPFLGWQGYANTAIVDCQAPFFGPDSIKLGENFGDQIAIESFKKGGYGTVGYVIYVSAVDSWTVPIDGSEPIQDTVWRANGQQCVYNGASNRPNVTITGLQEEATYYFKVYAYNICEETSIYEKTGAETQITTKVANKPPEGNGYASNPYKIANLENLAWVMYNYGKWDAYYEQTADVDASATHSWNNGKGFMPIGNAKTYFEGIYNGKGYVIDQLNINYAEDSLIGFFGIISGNAIVENIGLTNMNIKGGRHVGGIVGLNNGGKIEKCYTTGLCEGGDISFGWGAIGGIVGYNAGYVKYSYSNSNIQSTYDVVGGLAGLNAGYISCSYAIGNVKGRTDVGGLVGFNFYLLYHCYSSSFVDGFDYVGGLVGYGDPFYVLSSFWDKDIADQSSSYGGEGLTTDIMREPNGYVKAAWDFMNETDNGTVDIWGLNSNKNDGYPFLWWQGYNNTEEITITDVEDFESEKENVTIYPNPVSDLLYILLKNGELGQLTITDLTGKTILKKDDLLEVNTINMSSYKSGIYIVTIYTDSNIYSRKIIKN